MNLLLIGNAISMVGCLIMVLIGFLKRKNAILIAQCVQCLFMGAGNLILGGISILLSGGVAAGMVLAAGKKRENPAPSAEAVYNNKEF